MENLLIVIVIVLAHEEKNCYDNCGNKHKASKGQVAKTIETWDTSIYCCLEIQFILIQ